MSSENEEIAGHDVRELEGLTPEEMKKKIDEWEREAESYLSPEEKTRLESNLETTKDDIATLKQIIEDKEKQKLELEDKLGITKWTKFKENVKEFFEKMKIDKEKGATEEHTITGTRSHADIGHGSIEARKSKVDIDKPQIEVRKSRVELDKPQIDVGKLKTDVEKPLIDVRKSKPDLSVQNFTVDSKRMNIENRDVNVDNRGSAGFTSQYGGSARADTGFNTRASSKQTEEVARSRTNVKGRTAQELLKYEQGLRASKSRAEAKTDAEAPAIVANIHQTQETSQPPVVVYIQEDTKGNTTTSFQAAAAAAEKKNRPLSRPKSGKK